MFSWSDGIEVTTRNYDSLNEGAWVDDTIIEFYLRYVLSTKTDRAKCHLFGVFFYNKLTTRPEDQIEADTAKIRHSQVGTWNQNVDIFGKNEDNWKDCYKQCKISSTT
jgi:Ulp1 family protease